MGIASGKEQERPRNDMVNFQRHPLLPKQNHFEARMRTRWYPIPQEWSVVRGMGYKLSFEQYPDFRLEYSWFSPFCKSG